MFTVRLLDLVDCQKNLTTYYSVGFRRKPGGNLTYRQSGCTKWHLNVYKIILRSNHQNKFFENFGFIFYFFKVFFSEVSEIILFVEIWPLKLQNTSFYVSQFHAQCFPGFSLSLLEKIETHFFRNF